MAQISPLAEQALASGLVQPDTTTCGSCVLVVARMLNDPSYAKSLVDDEAPGTLQDRFKQRALAMHRLTSKFKDTSGGWQLPWPKALGTQPWALAREMTNEAGEKGKKYAASPLLPGQRARSYRRVAALNNDGDAIPLFVGNRWAPRHVVLALPAEKSGDVRIYDPASGDRYPLKEADFSAARLDVAGWQVPWLVVVPS